jgi:hypothetical protein
MPAPSYQRPPSWACMWGRLRCKIDGPYEPPTILNVPGKGFILLSKLGSLRWSDRDYG